MHKLIDRFRRDTEGSTLIETAFIAPVLVAMTLSGVEVSSMISRQTELQTIAGHAMEIILASAPTSDAETDRTIKEASEYIANTSGLTLVTGSSPNAGELAVYKRWRCGNNSERQATEGCANTAQTESVFIVIDMKDTYTPVWTNYGIGDNLTFHIKRSVQIG